MSKKTEKDWKNFKEEAEALDLEVGEIIEPAELALDHVSYQELEEKLTLAEQASHENWEKSVRLTAELDNVRRRAEREVSNAHRYGLEKLITALLPVMDSLEQASQLAALHEDKSMQEGIGLTMKLCLDVLEKFDVEQLDPQGDLFDPQQHEAMSIQPSTVVPNNAVLTVFQKGYRLNDRVIRPARVIVAKNP